MISVEVTGLTKYFRDILIFEDINFRVNSGEVFGIIGPNGVGKTTLLKILATLITPTKGKVTVNGFDVIKEQIRVKNLIGLVTSEERSLYWRLTGMENLKFFSAFYNLSSNDAKRRINYLMGLLNMDFLDKRVGECSSGMKQKISIARVLLHNPSVLLMDEPTKSLDTDTSVQLRTIIKEKLAIAENKTIILTTHNIQESEQMCDRVYQMNKC